MVLITILRLFISGLAGEERDADGVLSWLVAQVLVDKDELNDWEVRFTVSLVESRAQARAVVRFENAGAIG